MTTHNGSAVPTYVHRDTTLRAKIIDACGMTCTFCHNEGTPVTADNRNRSGGPFRTTGPSGRVSIYAASNGAQFLTGTMFPDNDFADALTSLGPLLGLTELHLTGGEPTLHPRLPELIAKARDLGFRVCMTSNGERGAQVIPASAKAGLDRVNFSVFGTTPSELAQVQHSRFRDSERAAQKITALHHAIEACEYYGVTASANIVVPNLGHIERVHRLLDEYSPVLSVRLLNSLDHGQQSIDAINQILDERKAIPEAHHIIAGVSGARTTYRTGDGRTISFKQIRPIRLPQTCAGCRFNNDTDCQEGFYGLRLYRTREGQWMVGVCIQRMDLCQPIDEFLDSKLANEVATFREAEYARLTYHTTA